MRKLKDAFICLFRQTLLSFRPFLSLVFGIALKEHVLPYYQSIRERTSCKPQPNQEMEIKVCKECSMYLQVLQADVGSSARLARFFRHFKIQFFLNTPIM